MNPNIMILDSPESFRLLEVKWGEPENYYLEVYTVPEKGAVVELCDYEKLDWSEYEEQRDAGKLNGKIVELTEREDDRSFDMYDVIEAVKEMLEATRVLPQLFTVTIHDYGDRKVLDVAERYSWTRGYGSDKTQDGKRQRGGYIDDPLFVNMLAAWATVSYSDMSREARLINFLKDGGLDATVTAHEAETRTWNYDIEFEFEVDWSEFDWESAVCQLPLNGTYRQNVQAILNLFRII